MAGPKIQLPENYDPYDMQLKLQFSPQADSLNVIGVMRKHPTLLCGAGKNGEPCKRRAGYGTDHVGYGRCKYHGGASTGPKTEEGKARASQNNRIHGLYSKTLLPEEQEIFNGLAEFEATSLEYEINLLRTKIIAYLQRNQTAYEQVKADKGDEEAYRALRVWYSEGENGRRSYYHATTIEDKALDNALNTLRRLVETHKRLLDPDKQENLIDTINAELRAASQGQVSLSWGGQAQGLEAATT